MVRTSMNFVFTALAALLVAMGLHIAVLFGEGLLWNSWIHVTLFGWITGFIYAVNYHTMPVFTGRNFPLPRLIYGQWFVWMVGLGVAVGGLSTQMALFYRIGLGLELLGSILFVINVISLFKVPATRPKMPAPAYQPPVDRLATLATKISGMSLPIALIMLLLVEFKWLGGRWYLAAEHLVTLGWIMLMVIGVGFHVLPRWSGTPIKSIGWFKVVLACHITALLFMVPALGTGWSLGFIFGAFLMSLALGLAMWSIYPTLRAPRPHPSRLDVIHIMRPAHALNPASLWCIRSAGIYLAFGIGLGATFSIIPGLGGYLRPVHAESNLWGFVSLLIYGMGYHMIPRFMGAPLRLQALAQKQAWLAIASVAITIGGWFMLLGELPGARIIMISGGIGQALASIIFFGLMLDSLQRHVFSKKAKTAGSPT